MLELTSESVYFERFIFLSRPRAITLPLAAHAQRGVMNIQNLVKTGGPACSRYVS